MSAKSQRVDEQLLRAIGVLGLTANIVNTTVGASIFKLPADMSKQLGAAAPLAFVVCAIAMALFVTSFALAGSRVSLTGGLYAYAELAFGKYVGFVTGLFYYTTAVLSVAAVVNFFAGTVVALIPALAGPVGHFAILLIIYGGLAAINVRGVREGTGTVGIVTV
ncbi:MAG TPA: amino acid permease, partial [Chthoniobacterales bacterium]|nr:amino acid permease [Chthoniobacterales bacterium]